jgi:hypothetical protein
VDVGDDVKPRPTSDRPPPDDLGEWTWSASTGWSRVVVSDGTKTPADMRADVPGPGWRRLW